MSKEIRRVCVYCASSRQANPAYREAAYLLGAELARHGVTIVYGGGGAGSMGALAEGALESRGRVIGVLPRFMDGLEWGHRRLTEMRLVDDMHERKRMMLEGSDAVVALPGGCGTLEELFEAITWKRLGLYSGPIAMLNTLGFFDGCAALLEDCIAERFMAERHRQMWMLVDRPEDVLAALQAAPPWDERARMFAVV